MTILGIGVDLIHLPRIASLLSRRNSDRFARRILSVTEYGQWECVSEYREQVRFLAVRWCVKEAAYKALYPAARPTWKEFTYLGLSDGRKPTLDYHPLEAESLKRLGRTHVSVSHDGEYVYSSVLFEGNVAHTRWSNNLKV